MTILLLRTMFLMHFLYSCFSSKIKNLINKAKHMVDFGYEFYEKHCKRSIFRREQLLNWIRLRKTGLRSLIMNLSNFKKYKLFKICESEILILTCLNIFYAKSFAKVAWFFSLQIVIQKVFHFISSEVLSLVKQM